MRISLLADIHANREALTACLDHAAGIGAERYAFLGDLVGYGADPAWVIDTIASYCEAGAICVLGNHDDAVLQEPRTTMRAEARAVVEWTRAQLVARQIDFLQKLPLQVELDDILFVHANAWAPQRWEYIHSPFDARSSMAATRCRLTFCGHVHQPQLYHMGLDWRATAFTPVAGTPIPLGNQRRWLAIAGSVGQPRDGIPAACTALFDTAKRSLTFYRVPYDTAAAAAKDAPPACRKVSACDLKPASELNAQMTTLAPGVSVDGFRLGEIVYRGGMAVLWRVTRADTAMPLVMKVPRLEYGEDAAAIVGFEVEQMIMPALSGMHVPHFVAAGDFTALPYIVMEFIEGPSLRARLEQAPLPSAEVAALGAKVATALHHLHRQNVIHLDLKPSSVLFRASGEAVLIDYGLAHHNHLPDLLAEQFHLPLGTGPYMSPEQVYGVRNDARSDLFALGVTLYFLATGERPFGNPTSLAGLRKRLYAEPPPPRALQAEFPPWLQEIILHCLEVDPAKRYSTAAQIAFDLQHPQQLALTERATRATRGSFGATARRWLGSLGAGQSARNSVADHLATAPIIMVAVNLMPGMEALGEALRRATRRVLAAEPGARLSCVSVLKTSRLALDSNVDAEGRNLHVQRLVELKHWARELDAPPDRITFQVLEAPDAATALIEYARNNHVDQMVVGARGSSAVRRFLGSVSSRIVAEAPCTVTVVRVPQAERAAEQ